MVRGISSSTITPPPEFSPCSHNLQAPFRAQPISTEIQYGAITPVLLNDLLLRDRQLRRQGASHSDLSTKQGRHSRKGDGGTKRGGSPATLLERLESDLHPLITQELVLLINAPLYKLVRTENPHPCSNPCHCPWSWSNQDRQGLNPQTRSLRRVHANLSGRWIVDAAWSWSACAGPLLSHGLLMVFFYLFVYSFIYLLID